MDKKKPHIPEWKMWLLIIMVTQALTAAQCCWMQQRCFQNHQLLWDSVERQTQIVREHIENTTQYLEKLNQLLRVAGK